MFWLWVERFAWLTILLVNTKRIIDFVAPYFLGWCVSFFLKNKNLVRSDEEGDDLNRNIDLSHILRTFEAVIKEFFKPAIENSRERAINDDNGRNGRVRIRRNQ